MSNKEMAIHQTTALCWAGGSCQRYTISFLLQINAEFTEQNEDIVIRTDSSALAMSVLLLMPNLLWAAKHLLS